MTEPGPEDAGLYQPASFVYPFAREEVPPGRLELALAILERLDACYGLFGPRECRALRSVAVFASCCSPADASEAGLESACLFLYAFTYLNNVVPRVDLPERAGAYWAGISARPTSEMGEAARLNAAGRALREQLLLHSSATDQFAFTHALWSTLAACTWEARHAGGWPTELDQYLACRRATIAVQAFLELWKIVGGFSLGAQQYVATRLEHLDALSREVQLLANDLCSEHIDAERNQHNAVHVAAAQDFSVRAGAARERARRQLRRRHDDTVEQLAREIADLRALSDAPAKLRWYLDFVQTCTRGNVDAMLQLAERYAPCSTSAATRRQ